MRRSPHRARLVAALATAIALFAAARRVWRSQRRELSSTCVRTVSSSLATVFFACGSCSARVRRGTVLTLRASPRRHFSFSRWSGDCVGTARTCVVLVDRPTSVRAVFVGEDRTVMLTVGGPGHVVSRPRGLDCGAGHDSCSADFPWGTKLRLVPVPAAVGRFARWGAACWNFGAGACTLAVRHELSAATAAFGHVTSAADPQHLKVTFVESGDQHVTSTPAGIDCPKICDASFPARHAGRAAGHGGDAVER